MLYAKFSWDWPIVSGKEDKICKKKKKKSEQMDDRQSTKLIWAFSVFLTRGISIIIKLKFGVFVFYVLD